VREGYTGSLVEKGDAEGFAKATEELLQDRGLREQMSENCRRVAVQEYALNVQSARYVELYEALLEESGRKALKREESSAARASVGAAV
jgi:glycosyltransferase involved in cell wall biosynthesis